MEVSIKDLKDKLSEYLRQVAEGEEVVITYHNRRIARIIPMSQEAQPEEKTLERVLTLPWIKPGNGHKMMGTRNMVRPAKKRGLVKEEL